MYSVKMYVKRKTIYEISKKSGANVQEACINRTSRDRPKWAPYPSKNSKRTSKCQFTVLENRKSKKMDRVARRGPLARASGALKGGHFRKCQHFCRSWRGNPLKKKQIFEKSITMPKNWKGDPLGFLNRSQCWSGEKLLFSGKKSHSAEKNWKGDPLVSPGMVCYAEKPFWFSSLSQMMQFGAIIFCRTFKNYFGQFVWIEKKVTIRVAFHFMKRRLKIGRNMNWKTDFWIKKSSHANLQCGDNHGLFMNSLNILKRHCFELIFSRRFMKWNATIIVTLFFSIHTNWPK